MTSPNKAIHLGIGMVHQHFELVPSFTAAENICMGHEPRNRFGAVDKREMLRYTQELSDTSGLKIDPAARVGDLSVGLRAAGGDPQGAQPRRGDPDPGRTHPPC